MTMHKNIATFFRKESESKSKGLLSFFVQQFSQGARRMYKNFNANPKLKRASDCTVRAISKVVNRPWEEIYIELCGEGLLCYDMPTANHVWGSYLVKKGFERKSAPSCPNCYTVSQFCDEHHIGSYVLALQGHVVAAIDGDYFDTWDSGDEVVLYHWERS